MKKIILISILMIGNLFALELHKVPDKIVLDGEKGGYIDGDTWESTVLKGKIHMVFYVDPDKKDINHLLEDTLKAKHFDKSKVSSIAIINLAATWLPNFILETMLEEKQKKFPDTSYVKDKKKVLVKEWHLSDDNYNFLLFNKKGELIYKTFDKVEENDIHDIITLIEKNL